MKKIIFIYLLLLPIIGFGQKIDSIKYAELTSHRDGYNYNLKFNVQTEHSYVKLPDDIKYPIDALNYLSKEGWRLVCVFNDEDGTRHYELEKH